MGPVTRSMAQDSIFPTLNVEQITDTLDPIQKTFICDTPYRSYWRYALFHRYVGRYKPNGISTSWINYGPLHAPLPTDTEVDCGDIPSGLYQSTLQINKGDTKLLKIHVYYTTGKILIQGKACRAWVDSEFDRLRDVVHTLAVSRVNPTRLSLTDTPHHPDNAAATPSIVTTAVFPNITASSILTPAILPASEDDSALLQASRSTTHHLASASKSHRLNSPSAIVSDWPGDLILPSSSPPSLSPDYIRADDTISSINTPANSTTYTNNSCVETPTNSVFSNTAINNACSSPTNTRATETTHKDTACGSDTDFNIEFVPLVVHTTAVEELQSQISALRASLLEMREHFSTEIDHLQTVLRSYDRQKIPSIKTMRPQPDVKNIPPKQQHKNNPKPAHSIPDDISNQQPSSPSPHPASPKQDRNNPKPSHTAPDDTPDQQPSSPSPPPSQHTPTPSTFKPDSTNMTAYHTNEDWPELPLLPENTKTILLGDSVIKGLHEGKMSVGKEKAKVLSISGMNKSKLISLLNGTLPMKQIETAVLHIGANDCKLGYVIGKGAWRSVINAAQRCFPNATLFLSSILPDRDSPNTCITSSNRNMSEVCHAMQIRYIDNDRLFCWPDGFPIKSLFRDILHPNTRGASALAVSIKRHYSVPDLTRNTLRKQDRTRQAPTFGRTQRTRTSPLLPNPPPLLSPTHFPPLPTRSPPTKPPQYEPMVDNNTPPPPPHNPTNPILPPTTHTQPAVPMYPPPYFHHQPPIPAVMHNYNRPQTHLRLPSEERSLIFSLLTRLLA